MATLVPIGSIITLMGLGGLIFCIITVMRARRAGLADDALKARLQQVVAWNVGALAISAIGLMLVIVGIFLA